MPDAAKNFAKGTLTQGYDDEAISIVLVTGDGARFPSVPFNATWWNSTDFPDPSDDPNREIVRVTAISTDTLTVTRAQEGTSAQTHELEGKVYKLIAGLTAKVINDEMLNASRDAGGVFIIESLPFTIQAPVIAFIGDLGSDKITSGSTLGTVVSKLPVHDDVGDLIGYIPIYNSIT
jgi:hypothetical protein